MNDIFSLDAERAKRERPSPEFIRKDDFGREMFCFTMVYTMAGDDWSAEVWAYDKDDAEKRVAAMRDNLRLDGQLFRSTLA